MRSGDRKYIIVVERKTAITDEYGGDVDTWTELGSFGADVRFSKGSERRQAAQEGAAAPATFIVLSNDRTRTISVTDRIVFDSATWDITSSIPSREFNAHREIEAVRVLA